MLGATDFSLVNAWQRGFPLAERPFLLVAAAAGLSEADALARLRRLQGRGVIDRVGPVFRPNAVGASTLAAMAVPAPRLDEVAALVSGEPGVNHNYEREHRCNLWFVATGADAARVEQALCRIERSSGLRVLRLPLIDEYHVDLGFDLGTKHAPRTAAPARSAPLAAAERRLVAAAARGLPLVEDPYGALAGEAGMTRTEVIALLRRMLEDGRIRRLGLVVRHRSLGYDANAMAVWDVADAGVAARGRALAEDRAVTLCYRRARVAGEWTYNLYCMVHGRSRETVLADIARLEAQHGLAGLDKAVLLSRRCFTQRAARYG